MLAGSNFLNSCISCVNVFSFNLASDANGRFHDGQNRCKNDLQNGYKNVDNSFLGGLAAI